jgi:transcriptional regulator GlxA family with amidase domain
MTSAVYGQANAFAIAAYISGRRNDASWSGHDIKIVTPGGLPVKGYSGHSIEPHGSLAGAGDSNVVLIPPIFNDIERTLADETGLVARLASFPRDSRLLASRCTGAFLLAEAGLLKAAASRPTRPSATFSRRATLASGWPWTSASSTTTW